MALITFDQIDVARRQKYGQVLASKRASVVFSEEKFTETQEFTVFLSHSYYDAKLNMDRLLGLKAFLEEFNCTVYVDWLIDRELDREKVTEYTANKLRLRMDHSKCLLFATSENSLNSKWMPWELGYKDGQSRKDGSFGRVGVLPISATTGQSGFAGQEYLGIYPHIEAGKSTTGDYRLWVYGKEGEYVDFDSWLTGVDPFKHED